MSRLVEELDEELFDDLLNGRPVFVVDFYADWCGPCKALAPVIERAAKRYAGRITFGKLNIDYIPDIAARYGVRSIPTLILFHDGKAASRAQGYISDARLQAHLDGYAPPTAAAEQTKAAPRGGFLGRLFNR